MLQIEKIQRLALTAMFAAIILIMAFTPLGFIPLVFIKATVIHVPVIIASILLGPSTGALLGGLFGLTSLVNNTFAPALTSFVFTPAIPVPGLGRGSFAALIVCFVPRILVGVVPYYVYRAAARLTDGNRDVLSLAVAGVAGSLTNTLLVMHLIYFLFRDAYAAARGVPLDAVYGAILAIIFGNGVPEAIVAGVLTLAICKMALALPIFRVKPSR